MASHERIKKKRVRNERMTSERNIKRWGPAAWKWLHVVAWTYPELASDEDRRRMFSFLESFALAIPCASCRAHFVTILERDLRERNHSAQLATREALSRATVEWHNEVNRRLGRQEMCFTAADRLYGTQHVTARVHSTESVLVLVMILCTVYVIIRRRATSLKR